MGAGGVGGGQAPILHCELVPLPLPPRHTTLYLRLLLRVFFTFFFFNPQKLFFSMRWARTKKRSELKIKKHSMKDDKKSQKFTTHTHTHIYFYIYTHRKSSMLCTPKITLRDTVEVFF